MEENELATSKTFSMRPSMIQKLNALAKKLGKSRSQLLDEWLNHAYDAEFPRPISLDEELMRR